MKKLLVTLLATASLAVSPIGFGATQAVEAKDKEAAHIRSSLHSAVDVVILRFDAPIADLDNKIAEFKKNQATGISYSTKDAARFFSQSDQVFVEFNKAMGEVAGNSGSMASWAHRGVPVTSVTDNGKTKITTHKTTMVETGASASVSVSYLDEANRADVALKIHQIVPVSGTDVSPYSRSVEANMRDGEILPMFWTNNGAQYCAFLTFHVSEDKI